MPPSDLAHASGKRPRAAGRRRFRPLRWILALVTLMAAFGGSAWGLGYSPRDLWEQARRWTSPPPLETYVVDEGSIPVLVVESGTLESANNTPVKCKVKALLGTVGSSLGGIGGGGMGGGGGGRGGGGRGGAGGGTAGASASSPGASGASASGGGMGGAAGQAATKGAAGAATKGAAGGAAGGAAAKGAAGMAGAGGGSMALQAPVIRSFTYVVTPYVPLRGPATTTRTSTVANSGMSQQMMGGGGGGGRGGGGMMGMERQGSTRILTILPEGTRVKAGDVVCTLDSAAFRDELAAQKIRHAQAKSWVEQAEKMAEVNEIALREYRDGILPQDRLLIKQYIASCETQLAKAREELLWAEDVFRKGLRTEAQLKADRFAYERAQIALQEAKVMQRRLDKFTAPRLITNLEAKQASIQSDLLAQRSAFQLEDNRLRDLEQMIENCTIRAPMDGIVVYAVSANAWGRVEDQIREGVSVREGQPIFNIPDPTRMRVRAKVNESKVAMIHTGQKVEIRVDAFPDQPLTGTVAEVTAIPAPAAGPISDVKVYSAMINIDLGGFQGLRPGMSAEVSIVLDHKQKVTRVPVQAIRREGGTPYVAVALPGGGYHWRELELGVVSPAFAEVRSGVAPGERVVADPDSLPAPPPPPVRTAANGRSSPTG
jgi:HlyD family secretion protein